MTQLRSSYHSDLPSNSAGSDSCYWDEYNNLIRKVSFVSDSVKITNRIGYTKAGAWCKNAVAKDTAIEMYSSAKQQRIQSYSYDTRGNMTYHYTDYGVSGALYTYYSLIDDFGNATNIRNIANSQIRLTKLTYSDNGRFFIKKSDHLSQETTYRWDEARGLLLSDSTRMGVTTYTYDSFGTLLTTTYPNGKSKTQTAEWAAQGPSCPVSGCKYVITTIAEGSSPVVIWYNTYGQEIASRSIGFGNSNIYTFTQYLGNGKIARVSKPTYNSIPAEKDWAAVYEYDDYGRVKKTTSPQGITAISHNLIGRINGSLPMRTETVTTPDGQTKVSHYDNSGLLVKSVVNGKAVIYTYTLGGKMKSATPEGGAPVTFKYDRNGNRIQIKDPSASSVDTEYDQWGQLIKQTQQLDGSSGYAITTYTYAVNGLLSSKSLNNVVTNYVYNSSTRLLTRMYSSESEKSFTYDAYDRVTQISTKINGKTLTSKKEYDVYGRVTKETYPSGYYILNNYDAYSNFVSVTDGAARQIWELLTCDAEGKVLTEKKGNVISTYHYTEKGQLDSIAAPGIVDMRYTFYPTGNIKTYKDARTNQTEEYTYDTMDRLVSWKKLPAYNALTYYNNTTNTISEKTDPLHSRTIFSYTYAGSSTPTDAPYHLSDVTSYSSPYYSDQEITYTAFKKVKTIQEYPYGYTFYYGPDEQQLLRKRTFLGATQERYYAENYEEDNDYTPHKQRHYIYGGSGLAAIYSAPREELYSAYTDALGSLVALAKGSTLSERYAYDPWGKRRDPNNWALKAGNTDRITNRGYTMHEHIDEIGLINMNARLYDPYTSQFLSPDPQLQDPGNWLNYNRYTYCMNNPLKYVDPDGEFFHLIIGAIVGGISNWISNGCKFNAKGLGYFAVGAAAGALTAGVGTGVSSVIGGGAFGAGFLGTSAAKTAVSSFISGSLIGGSGGAAGGFTIGFGNALVEGTPFDKALGKGFSYGAAGLASGAVMGGIFGGLQAVKDGRRFFSGSRINDVTLVDRGLAYIPQEGDVDCVSANIQSQSRGQITQEQIRNAGIRGDKNGLNDVAAFKYFNETTGRTVNVLDPQAGTEGILKNLSQGKDIAANLNTGGRSGHMVSINRVVNRTIIKASGKVVNKQLFYVMNPSRIPGVGGAYMKIATNKLINSYNIFSIHP